MSAHEEAIVFPCAGETLVGVLARPDRPARVGVLIVVGGPQYRAGSHRQFVLLARVLAEAGIPVLRFDVRGMGDSTGGARDFRDMGEDIAAATEAFVQQAPEVEQVVLWGLCDGASAACFHAPRDPRVAGLVLVNPWVRTAGGQAETYLRHYYSRRLGDVRFWKKLASGRVDLVASVGSLWRTAMGALAGRRERKRPARDLPEQMAHDLGRSGRPFAIMLSERDYVAQEFEQVARERGSWRGLLEGGHGVTVRFADADHTFSGAARRDALAQATLDWLRQSGLVRGPEDATQLRRCSHEHALDRAG